MIETYERQGIRNVPAYLPEQNLNVKTEMLEMQKNWGELEKETSDVNSNMRHLIRSEVQPYSYAGQVQPPVAMPERVE